MEASSSSPADPPLGRRPIGEGEELPVTFDALEGMMAAVGEAKARPGDKIPGRVRHQHLPAAGDIEGQ
jgi:hypothetical protein